MSRTTSDGGPSLAPGLELQPDTWLSRVLGKPAFQVVLDESSKPQEQSARAAAKEPLFATFKVAVEDVARVAQLQDLGFRVVDTALTFERGPLAESVADGVRFAGPQDRDRVVEIASSAFTYSRFHLDPTIPDQVANRVKGEWAANYFNGDRGEAMVVAECDGAVAGFLLMLRGQEGGMIIDLVAVDPRHARRGHGRAMIAFAATHGFGDGRVPASTRVGTQAANTPSVRFYESLGFRLCCAQHVLHYHGDGGWGRPSPEAGNG